MIQNNKITKTEKKQKQKIIKTEKERKQKKSKDSSALNQSGLLLFNFLQT